MLRFSLRRPVGVSDVLGAVEGVTRFLVAAGWRGDKAEDREIQPVGSAERWLSPESVAFTIGTVALREGVRGSAGASVREMVWPESKMAAKNQTLARFSRSQLGFGSPFGWILPSP